MEGKGTASTASGTLDSAQMHWKARANREEETPTTSPEELISAAMASCFSMALSNALAQQGNPPEHLHVTATTAFHTGEGGAKINDIHVDVKGKVPGIDQQGFQQAVDQAKVNCPVSQALKGNVQITAKGELQS
jgi:osmotically inducible protein OsmC